MVLNGTGNNNLIDSKIGILRWIGSTASGLHNIMVTVPVVVIVLENTKIGEMVTLTNNFEYALLDFDVWNARSGFHTKTSMRFID